MNKFKKIGIAISLGFAMLGGIWLASPSQAAGCNSFNVVYCGTHSMSELQTAYSRTEIKELYKEWYVTETMVQGGSNMREGVVDANGNITVDGRVVATNAITVQSKAGTRQPQPQRSYKTSNGYTYYQYTTGQSFVDGPKSYNIYAWFDNNGSFITGVIKDCGNPVWGNPTTPPAKPALTCDALQVTEISRNTFKFSVKATAKGGASITSYTYNFGDNNIKTTNSSEIQYTYAKEGNYTVTITVNGKETGEVKRQNPNCQKTVTVKPEPKMVVCVIEEGGKKYTKEIKKEEFNEKIHKTNLDECKETPAKITVCVIEEGGKKYTKEIKKEEFNEKIHKTNLDECKETPAPTPNTPSTPTPSPELPKTGASDAIMSALGLGGLTTATIAYIASRRQM
ncbi:PKD domain-containing protein [Candidatus Nanosynbacter sp. TM7-076]|uniref:PKD domain-containing protein n=1 Tax=Candidatus Nanosynbacter sp. TM7-076 TaxID=2902629 RepID=UPI001FB703A2|nr:PKD domain-containing protein [Candidatus Nanosynbacter sp. TM7-076]MCJ1968184.1 PKD domain-containing protein [Candidatus Nanosynbacter sp. TM7-076]